MEAWVRAVVESIHAAPGEAVIYLSGGASQVLGWLLSVPGASNTVLEAVVPYSRSSMIQLLGKVPAQFASRQTSEDLALVAYNRGLKLSRPGSRVIGVGFTGSLASLNLKKGDHRFFVSARSCDRLWTSNVTLLKGLRTREEEDKVSSYVLLKALADACKVSTASFSGLSKSEEADENEVLFNEDEELQQLIDGKVCMKIYHYSGGVGDYKFASNSERKIILPGSFNPLHEGHLKLLEVASSIHGDGLPCFEVSAINADKPPLTVAEIKNRVKQFEEAGKTVIISNQPYFYKKAELFPGSSFVVGADTATRLVNPKYYGGDRDKMLEILIGCMRSGTTFLVGGRSADGVFKILEDLDIPEEVKGMFVGIPSEAFRVDISSTEIRNRTGMPQPTTPS